MDHLDFENEWARCEPRLRAFLAAGCRDPTLVDDLAQQVAMVAWNKRAVFDSQQSFLAWLIGIAQFELLRHRRDAARCRTILAPDLIEQLAFMSIAETESPDHRRQALADCIGSLGEAARTLLRLRYADQLPLAEAAQRLGRTHGAIRTALVRLREFLHRCVSERVMGVQRVGHHDDVYTDEP